MTPSNQAAAAVGRVLLIAGILLGGSLRAQEALIRATTQGTDELWTGQNVTLIVELLAPGYFAGAPSFDLPDPQGVLLVPPMDHPVVGRESIDDVDYTVQRHELLAYPMRAGDLTIPPIRARFAFKRAPLDTNTVQATVTTPPQSLKVKTPPGAENLGQVISARDLKLEEHWQPEPTDAAVKAGAAFVRTITFTAPNVPGMVFPPFPTDDIEGLGIYARHRLLDQSDRGTLQGGRQDILTYLCQRPGQFTIPATRFIWFDLAGSQLRTNDLPARTLNVVANEAYASTLEATSGVQGRASTSKGWWWLAGFGLLIASVVLAWRRPSLRPALGRLASPFRPWTLQPLNPTDLSQPTNRTGRRP